MVVDSSPMLTHDDWIKDQHEDSDIGFLVQLLKAHKLIKICSQRNGFLRNSNSFEI